MARKELTYDDSNSSKLSSSEKSMGTSSSGTDSISTLREAEVCDEAERVGENITTVIAIAIAIGSRSIDVDMCRGWAKGVSEVEWLD
jgi:hypothetical protein